MSEPPPGALPRAAFGLAAKWYWMPAVVLALGVGSIALLIGGNWIRERLMAEDIELVRAVGEIETRIAISHLWIEEYVSGDEVPVDKILADLRETVAAMDRIIADGALGASRFLFKPSGETELPELARSARSWLASFAQLTAERRIGYERGDEVGIGSAIDIEYDSVFRELLADLEAMEALFKNRLAAAESRSRLLFRTILVAWIAIVALAVGGLWTREKRRQATAAALERSQEQLLQSQKMEALGRLAGGIAHDINNYLAAITAQCELEHMKAPPESRTARRMETVLSTVGSASALIKRLLAFSRRQPARPEPTDLGRVVRGLERMMTRLVGEDIRLRTELAADAGRVLIDSAQVEQIVLNLVVNAREAMPTGGELAIRVAAAEGNGVRLEVRDSGSGIDPKLQSRIFEPFFTTKDKSTNSGLGLATVLGIVEQNGGRIELDSAPGRGSAFTVVFPRTDLPEPVSEADQVGAADGHHGAERILLAEDNSEVRESTSALLREWGYTVETAANGAEALDLFERRDGRFDLVLSDVVMPEVGGRRLADLLAERAPDLPVVFTSGHTDSVVLRHGIAAGEVNFLAKPYSAAALDAKIREVLARAGARERAPGAEHEARR